MIVLSIVVGALFVVIGGGIVASQATTGKPDPHSPAGRAQARERARCQRRKMRAQRARPWQTA